MSENDNDMAGTRFGSGVGRRRSKRERMEVDYLEGQFLLLGSHVQVHTWQLVFAYVLRLEREIERALGSFQDRNRLDGIFHPS